MRLFYVQGEAQVSMSLEEFTTALKDAKQADSLTVTVNGSRRTAKVPAIATRIAAGRKRVASVAKRSRRMVSRRTMSAAVLKRRRESLAKARAVLAANRKATAKRRQPKRDWGPIIAKRNATLADKRAKAQQTEQAEQPMAAAQ